MGIQTKLCSVQNYTKQGRYDGMWRRHHKLKGASCRVNRLLSAAEPSSADQWESIQINVVNKIEDASEEEFKKLSFPDDYENEYTRMQR